MGLSEAEHAALRRLSQASLEDLTRAASRMPSYQRDALRWLARELGLLAPVSADPGGHPPALGLEHIRREALLERARLEQMIAKSSATVEDRAFLQQSLAHLWRRIDKLLGAHVHG